MIADYLRQSLSEKDFDKKKKSIELEVKEEVEEDKESFLNKLKEIRIMGVLK